MNHQTDAAAQADQATGEQQAATEYANQQRAADAPGPLPVEVEPDALAAAVELLKRCQAHSLPDILSQQVHAFIKAHG